MLERNIKSLTFEAGADLSSSVTTAATATAGFRRFVSLDANGKVVQSNAADTDCMGVCRGKPDVDEAVAVAYEGVVLVQAGSQVAIGESVGSDANGLANTAVAAGAVIQGVALTAAGVGDLFLIKLGQRTSHAALT